MTKRKALNLNTPIGRSIMTQTLAMATCQTIKRGVPPKVRGGIRPTVVMPTAPCSACGKVVPRYRCSVVAKGYVLGAHECESECSDSP